MKTLIRRFIREYVQEYQSREDIATVYGEPLVGFADAYHPYIQNLPKLISPTHELPQNVLPDAKIIIAYFVPFTRELARTNPIGGSLASPEWARAYEETNALFTELNAALIDLISAKAGSAPCCDAPSGHAAVTPKATAFYLETLLSDWSHRHIAYAAGLGTFGLNNMLLTKHGCCGRYSTVITNLDLTPDAPPDHEYCLYKKDGSCGVCMKNCPAGAITPEGYDRFKCYEVCLENAKIYTGFGSSYTREDGDMGSEVCGKCVTGSPCAFWQLK